MVKEEQLKGQMSFNDYTTSLEDVLKQEKYFYKCVHNFNQRFNLNKHSSSYDVDDQVQELILGVIETWKKRYGEEESCFGILPLVLESLVREARKRLSKNKKNNGQFSMPGTYVEKYVKQRTFCTQLNGETQETGERKITNPIEQVCPAVEDTKFEDDLINSIAIQEVVSELSEKEQQLLKYVVIDELPYKEVATLLETTEGGIKMRIKRLIEKCRKKLGTE